MIVDVQEVYEDDIPSPFKLTNQELEEWNQIINEIKVGPEVLNTIQLVKVKIEEHNARTAQISAPIVVNDRRWKKIIRLLRTSAFLNGREQVDLMDCFLLNHCLWSQPDQRPVIRDLIADAVAKHGYTLAVNLSSLKKEVKAFQEDVEQEIRIPHTTTIEKPLPVYDEFFRLVKEDNKFQGTLVRIKQFRDMTIDEPKVTNFFDEEKNLVNRIVAAKGTQENTIVVHHNTGNTIYPLEAKLLDQTEYLSKKPHRIVQQFWDERYQQLSSFIVQQLEHLQGNRPVEMERLEQNLFVDSEFASIVKKNYEEVVAHLQQLKLDLEKLQFSYTNV